MKLSLLFLLLLLGCQESPKPAPANVEKVSQNDEQDLFKEAFVLSTNVKGLQLSGENLSRKDSLTMAEDIKVIEKESGKVLDEFLLFDWGPVGFLSEGSTLKVLPKPGILEIIYSLDEQGVIQRKATCAFITRPDSTKIKTVLDSTKKENPDWDDIFSDLADLATEGDKGAFNFFMNPDREAKRIIRLSDGAAPTESIVKVLKFMKQSGCSW